MKSFTCFLVVWMLLATSHASLLTQETPLTRQHHLHHHYNNNNNNNNNNGHAALVRVHDGGLHFGKSSAIVIDNDHVTEHHPVYHHNTVHLNDADTVAVDVSHPHHDVDVATVQVNTAARVIQHEPIHQVEPVHHVTKVVHHEPHHFLHYTNPVVDHHVVHENRHIDEHQYAADLNTAELHHGDIAHNGGDAVLHHHRTAALVHRVAPVPQHHHHHVYQHHGTAAIVRLPSSTHSDLLTFAKQKLHGGYGKVRITEKHY